MSLLADPAAVTGWVASALLVLAGVAKLRRPAGTVRALGDARLSVGVGVVRALGLLEVVTGGAVLLVGGPVPAVVAAALYAGFTVFVLRQRRDRDASCGCFGVERSPVTGTHVAVNVVAALASGAAAVTGAPPLVDLLGVLGAAGAVTAAVLVATAAWLLRLALTAGADLQLAVSLHPRPEGNR